jgi:hypothetical protein
MEDSNHETITRLKFLSKIRKGEKINVMANTLQPDSMLTSLSRALLNTDNRQNSLTYIQNSVNSGFQLFTTYIRSERTSEKKLASQIIKDIIDAKIGINNLKNTYHDDTMFCCSIDTYLQTIDAKIDEYRELYPHIFPKDDNQDDGEQDGEHCKKND